MGTNSFFYIVDPFSEERQNSLTELPLLEVYRFPLKLSILMGIEV